ncbi:hypothetical protein [Chitinophaga filiformis]|uniref:Uncharacterized protein n=1 Tax=Chitinophaga filiformis TaxID=104663 RepID=A0A1G7SDC9_CHIFI|nr:hypothetical protein [Chitinophaga filiformis]SDG21038.1 hypothetical protein SAMN04488121_103830 [Chitinophaga filiformis]
MKNAKRLFAIATLCALLPSCRFLIEKPSREEAIAAIQLHNPDTAWARIRTKDSSLVDSLYLPILVNNGMVQLNKKATDSTGQLIFFTPEARPFFFPTPENERVDGVQRVLLGYPFFVSLLKVEATSEPDKAYVNYVVEYRHLTPFAAISKKLKEGTRDTFSQYIYKYGGVWQGDKSRKKP